MAIRCEMDTFLTAKETVRQKESDIFYLKKKQSVLDLLILIISRDGEQFLKALDEIV